jgi:hypothetical protein
MDGVRFPARRRRPVGCARMVVAGWARAVRIRSVIWGSGMAKWE